MQVLQQKFYVNMLLSVNSNTSFILDNFIRFMNMIPLPTTSNTIRHDFYTKTYEVPNPVHVICYYRRRRIMTASTP